MSLISAAKDGRDLFMRLVSCFFISFIIKNLIISYSISLSNKLLQLSGKPGPWGSKLGGLDSFTLLGGPTRELVTLFFLLLSSISVNKLCLVALLLEALNLFLFLPNSLKNFSQLRT